ncbi:MAG TPA: hypothetical protein VL463_10005 [Kofleriaceae bacterium]|nr:hypothetical protein [Kofleriaceae bacterium]
MIFVVVALVAFASAAATWGPLRAGAVCTPATHRARQGLALVCAALAVVGFARFIVFVVLRGHPAARLDVLIGQTIAATFALQAILLWRDRFPPRWIAIGLGLWCAAIAVLATIHAVRAI